MDLAALSSFEARQFVNLNPLFAPIQATGAGMAVPHPEKVGRAVAGLGVVCGWGGCGVRVAGADAGAWVWCWLTGDSWALLPQAKKGNVCLVVCPDRSWGALHVWVCALLLWRVAIV